MLARHFIYKQVYFHPIRRVYDIHLVDFLKLWLEGGKFSIECESHLEMTDAEVVSGIRAASRNPNAPSFNPARIIEERDHFRYFYSVGPDDKDGGVLRPGAALMREAVKRFPSDKIRHDYIPAKNSAPDFPVLLYDTRIQSSIQASNVIKDLPNLEVDRLYCSSDLLQDAIKWRQDNRVQILKLDDQGGLV